jgi:hypothetical protein
LACQVALYRYHRVSRNSAALIFPSVKHFLLQAFPFDVIQHHRIPHVITRERLGDENGPLAKILQ